MEAEAVTTLSQHGYAARAAVASVLTEVTMTGQIGQFQNRFLEKFLLPPAPAREIIPYGCSHHCKLVLMLIMKNSC